MIDPDLQLWRAVLAQAFSDLQLPPTLKDKVQRRARRQAMRWLTTNSEDLHTVCALANMSPHVVMRTAREMVA